MENLTKVYNLILDCLTKVPEEIYNSKKFGALVINSVINVVCDYANLMGIEEENLYKMIKQVWDGKYGKNPEVLN